METGGWFRLGIVSFALSLSLLPPSLSLSSTLPSFEGSDFADEIAPIYVAMAGPALDQWLRTEVLIVDEISMVSLFFLRHSRRPRFDASTRFQELRADRPPLPVRHNRSTEGSSISWSMSRRGRGTPSCLSEGFSSFLWETSSSEFAISSLFFLRVFFLKRIRQLLTSTTSSSLPDYLLFLRRES